MMWGCVKDKLILALLPSQPQMWTGMLMGTAHTDMKTFWDDLIPSLTIFFCGQVILVQMAYPILAFPLPPIVLLPLWSVSSSFLQHLAYTALCFLPHQLSHLSISSLPGFSGHHLSLLSGAIDIIFGSDLQSSIDKPSNYITRIL